MTAPEPRISSMSVRELKDFLRARHVDFSHCVEKQELVQLAVASADKAPSPPAAAAAAAAAPDSAASSAADQAAPSSSVKPLFFSAPVGPLQCNMSILGDPTSLDAVLIDPGGDSDVILREIKRLGVSVKAILITHAHFDHFLVAGVVQKALPGPRAPIYLHEADMMLWRMLPMQLQLLGAGLDLGKDSKGLGSGPMDDPDEYLDESTRLPVFGGTVLHTPGHTPGSCCFYFAAVAILFSGDTLFRRGVGRTDLPLGDPKLIGPSIRNKLFTLPRNTRVITGHGPETTIGEEAAENPFVGSGKL